MRHIGFDGNHVVIDEVAFTNRPGANQTDRQISLNVPIVARPV